MVKFMVKKNGETKEKRNRRIKMKKNGVSSSCVIEELAMLGVKVFFRMDSKNIKIEDVIITKGAVKLDGTSTYYAPLEYPAVSDFEIVQALLESAKELNRSYHVGITASSDTFYPGQEKYDSCSGYVIKKFQGSTKESQQLNVLNYEMESSTVLE